MNQLPLKQHFANHFQDFEQLFFSRVKPGGLSEPVLASINEPLATALGIHPSDLSSEEGIALMSGNTTPEHISPIALVYSGHQFGVWAGQLGDGRAITLGEAEMDGELWDLQLKGAGSTPYSRFADGRAVLRSSIREYLCSEAMYGLGIPTTRALCLIDSSTPVFREEVERGATICRVARSLIRFGSFEHFHYREQKDAVAALADYVIERHFPDWANNPDRYLLLLENAVVKTAQLIAQWQSVGFAHGVMNTDNMSMLGETLDYGPFGFLDSYNPEFICNHSDTQGRYSFKNQPAIGLWNLNALANAFLSLLTPEEMVPVLKRYEVEYLARFQSLMREKFGLADSLKEDEQLIEQLLATMAENQVDYTLFFRKLCRFSEKGDNQGLQGLFANPDKFERWSEQYRNRLALEHTPEPLRQEKMTRINPKFVLRNYLAQIAIEKAQQHDYSVIGQLLDILQSPFDEHSEFEHFASAPPDWASQICVSCSS